MGSRLLFLALLVGSFSARSAFEQNLSCSLPRVVDGQHSEGRPAPENLAGLRSGTAFGFAHVVGGDFGAGRFTTSFLIFNVSSNPANVTVAFTGDDGTPTILAVSERGAGSTFGFALKPGASAFVEAAGGGPLKVGAAVITSDQPVGASAILRVLDSRGNLLSETGMGDSPALSQFTFPVEEGPSVNTGIALHNPLTSAVAMTLHLLDSDGKAAGITQLALPPGNHGAKFVSELFPAVGNFRGSIAVTATDAVASVVLRQIVNGGLPSYTTLPVTSGVSHGAIGGTVIGPTPTQVRDLTGVAAVTDGAVLKNDGTVYALRATYADRTTLVSLTPTLIDGLSGVVAVSGRMALKSDRTVWEFSSGRPSQVPGLSDVAAIHQSSGGVMVLKRDGTVWVWWNPGIPGPIEVSRARGAVAVAELAFGGLALMSDGTVWRFGLMGEDSDSYLSYWGQIKALREIVAIDAMYDAVLALRSDGTVWKYGDRGCFQVQGIAGATGISAGPRHHLALVQGGKVREWGRDYLGLGDTVQTTWPTPRQVDGLTGVAGIAAGWYHSLALMGDGTVWVWTSE